MKYAVKNLSGKWLAFSETDGHHLWVEERERGVFTREYLEALDDTLLETDGVGLETYFDNSDTDIGWGDGETIFALAVPLEVGNG